MKSSYSMFSSPSWEEEEWDQRNAVKVQSMMKKKNNTRYTKRHHLAKTNMLSKSKHHGRFDSDIHTNKIATTGASSTITTKATSTTQYGGLSNKSSTINGTKNGDVTTSIGRTSNTSSNDAFAILSLWYYGNGDIDGISDISNVSKLTVNEESDSDVPSSSLAVSGDVSIVGMEFVITRKK